MQTGTATHNVEATRRYLPSHAMTYASTTQKDRDTSCLSNRQCTRAPLPERAETCQQHVSANAVSLTLVAVAGLHAFHMKPSAERFARDFVQRLCIFMASQELEKQVPNDRMEAVILSIYSEACAGIARQSRWLCSRQKCEPACDMQMKTAAPRQSHSQPNMSMSPRFQTSPQPLVQSQACHPVWARQSVCAARSRDKPELRFRRGPQQHVGLLEATLPDCEAHGVRVNRLARAV